MKNPLRKRLPRELKEEFGKYLVIFLFMVLLISLVSGFLVADNSIMDAYQKGFDQYNVEYGNLSTKNAIASKDRKAIEKENKLILYEQNYYELKESKECDDPHIWHAKESQYIVSDVRYLSKKGQ